VELNVEVNVELGVSW